MRRILWSLPLVAFAATAPAAEVVVDLDTVRAADCEGAAACTLGAAVLSAGPAPRARLGAQDYGGVVGLGVAATATGADRDDELQGPVIESALPGETLTIEFERPHAVARIVIGHLYNPDMPGDPAETAIIEAFRDGESLGTLRLQSISDAEGAFALGGTAGVASVRRLDARAGQYLMTEPFRGRVDRLVFRAGAVSRGDTADYSVVSMVARPGS